jgi:hypothetical protein
MQHYNPGGQEVNNNNALIAFTGSGRRCKVLFSYQPTNEDELKLVVDDVIDILAEVEEGWWKGRLGNMVSAVNITVVYKYEFRILYCVAYLWC